MRISPLIPAHLRWVALALGSALMAAGAFVPSPWSLYLATAGSVALFLGGLGWKAPAWAAGKPLVPMTLVPLLLTAVGFLERFLTILPESWQAWGTLLLGLLSLAAGKVLPEPMTLEGKPTEDGRVTISAGCSLADAAQGKCQ